MYFELLIVIMALLVIGAFAGLYEIAKLKADLKGEKNHINVVERALSEMEDGYKDLQHTLIRTTMEKEEVGQDFINFVDIVVDKELNMLSRLYYSERLDQVIEFRELTQIGEL